MRSHDALTVGHIYKHAPMHPPPLHTQAHTACTHLQHCSVLQCHHEEVEPLDNNPTHGHNVTARHLHQLRTSYYLSKQVSFSNDTTGILSPVELEHEHIYHMHACTHTQSPLADSTLHTATPNQFTHIHFRHPSQV